MRRKVIRQGHNTLTITLPLSWVQKNNITQGDELNLDEAGSTLIVTKENLRKNIKSEHINLDKLNYYFFVKKMTSLYRQNYTKIIIEHSITEIYNDKTKKHENINYAIENILKRFIGAEIILSTHDKIEIELMIYPLDANARFEEIEKRTFESFKKEIEEAIELFCENIESEKKHSWFYKKINQIHDSMTRLINYAIRELNKSDQDEFKKISGNTFYVFLDTLVDKIRDMSENMNHNNNNERMKNILRSVFDIFFEEYSCMISKKTVSEEFISAKTELKRKINSENFSAEENKIISEISLFMDTLNITSEYMIQKTSNIDEQTEMNTID